jgi:hypothetical protein
MTTTYLTYFRRHSLVCESLAGEGEIFRRDFEEAIDEKGPGLQVCYIYSRYDPLLRLIGNLVLALSGRVECAR